ncbi:TonB-dependent receptor [Sphingomonas cavernae]|nr:TonB-dependent receptor [Sphingomonas cavernae]
MASLQAQEASGSAAEPEASSREIIVTARKREESALEVPVIETVLTADTIERAAITSIDDIAKFAPGLQVGESVLSIGTQVSLRGIGTSAFDPGVDQSVSLNIDGLSFSQGLAFQSGTFDLAQIEVLKGPQALFFGKSSPGGVISIRTADPRDDLEVIVRSGYEFEANEYRGELILSAPITDTLGIRLAGMGYNGDGYFRNRAIGLAGTGAKRPDNRLGGGDGFQLRGTVKFEPSSAFDARLKLNYVEDTNEYPGAVQLSSCPEGTAPSAGNPFPRPIDPNDDCKLDRSIYLVDLDPAAFPLVVRRGQQFNDKQQTFGTLEMNLSPVEDLTLSSVTGYYDLSSTTQFNTFQTGYAGPGLAHQSFYDRAEFTQEIRLNSDFAGPLNFTAGAFYQNADVSLLQPVFGNRTVLPASRTTLSKRVNNLDIESWSIFGQLRFRPVETLELAVGGRYTDEKRGDEVFDFSPTPLSRLQCPRLPRIPSLLRSRSPTRRPMT